MKKVIFRFGLVLAAFVLMVSFASADVGVGISPSKIALQIECGKSQQMEFLMFNSGDSPIKMQVVVDGEIAKFAEVSGVSLDGEIIQPEPKPHALPIKNGKTFIVSFNPGMCFFEKKYSGAISIQGSPVEGSQFGGSVGVATQAEIITTPSAAAKGIVYAVIAILIIAVFLCWKRKCKINPRRRR